MPEKPRGVRLGNPGNIRHNPRSKWQGMSADQPDPSFVKFDDPVWGVRAIARILIKYDARGLNTVRKIIETWAPPTENDTEAYVEHAADELNVQPDDEIDVDSYANLFPLIKVIIEHENGALPSGKQWVPDKVIQTALHKAGIVGAEPPPSNTVKTLVVGAATTCCTAAASYVEPLTKASDAIAPMAEVSPWVGQARIILVTGAAVATLAGLYLAGRKHKNGL